MSDQPDNIVVLRHLRTLDIKMDRIIHEVQALKQHSLATADTLLAIRKDVQNLDQRVARIETRLDLRDVVGG